MSTAFRADWLGKSLAGLLLGLGLAVACSGLFVHLAPDNAPELSMKFPVASYLLLAIWTLVIALVFLFRTAACAWLWLGMTNLLAFALLAAAAVWT